MTPPDSPRTRSSPRGEAVLAARILVPCLLALACAPCLAQRTRMFGPYVEREISGLPIGFFSVPPEGPRKEFGLLTAQPTALSVMKLAAGDSLTVVRQVPLRRLRPRCGVPRRGIPPARRPSGAAGRRRGLGACAQGGTKDRGRPRHPSAREGRRAPPRGHRQRRTPRSGGLWKSRSPGSPC